MLLSNPDSKYKRKGIISIRVENNEIETKKKYKGSTNQNFLEGKASLIASYPNLAKERKESCLSTKKLKVDITKDTTEIQRIIRNYCENLYSNKSEKGYIPRK